MIHGTEKSLKCAVPDSPEPAAFAHIPQHAITRTCCVRLNKHRHVEVHTCCVAVALF